MPAKGNSPEYGSVCGTVFFPFRTFYGALNLSFSIFPAVAGLFFRR